MTPDKKEQRFLLPAQPRDTPSDLLNIALTKFNRAQGIDEHNPDDYILKVREGGREGGKGRRRQGGREREGGMERGREGGREGERREGGREREEWREGGKEGGRERRREGVSLHFYDVDTCVFRCRSVDMKSIS